MESRAREGMHACSAAGFPAAESELRRGLGGLTGAPEPFGEADGGRTRAGRRTERVFPGPPRGRTLADPGSFDGKCDCNAYFIHG
jgi:hypothetical protein